jgi:hypothetical protein
MKIRGLEAKGGWDNGFKYWFKNVFWYHYRPFVFIGIAVIAIVGFSIFQSVTNPRIKPDFMLAIISGMPVFSEQGEGLDNFFAEFGFNTSSTVIMLNDEISGMGGNPMMGWELLMVTLVNTENAMFIVGESMLGVFEEQYDAFFLMDELGLPAADFNPRLADVSESAIIQDLMMVFEPMYALIRYPQQQRNGSISPEDTARTEKAVECLRILLESNNN